MELNSFLLSTFWQILGKTDSDTDSDEENESPMKYTIADMELADNMVDVNSSDSEYDSKLFLLVVWKFNSRFQCSDNLVFIKTEMEHQPRGRP